MCIYVPDPNFLPLTCIPNVSFFAQPLALIFLVHLKPNVTFRCIQLIPVTSVAIRGLISCMSSLTSSGELGHLVFAKPIVT